MAEVQLLGREHRKLGKAAILLQFMQLASPEIFIAILDNGQFIRLVSGIPDYGHRAAGAKMVRLYQVPGSCKGILSRMRDEGTTN